MSRKRKHLTADIINDEAYYDEAIEALRVLRAESYLDKKMLAAAMHDCMKARLTVGEMMAVYAYRRGCDIRKRDREIYRKMRSTGLRIVGGKDGKKA